MGSGSDSEDPDVCSYEEPETGDCDPFSNSIEELPVEEEDIKVDGSSGAFPVMEEVRCEPEFEPDPYYTRDDDTIDPSIVMEPELPPSLSDVDDDELIDGTIEFDGEEEEEWVSDIDIDEI